MGLLRRAKRPSWTERVAKPSVLDCCVHIVETMVAVGEGKVTCTFGQNRSEDQYPVRHAIVEIVLGIEFHQAMRHKGHCQV
jgi:hypothetical protein